MTLAERFASWDANRKLIAVCALTMFLLLAWASLAQVDEITRGQGRVIPSSQAQLVQPALVEEAGAAGVTSVIGAAAAIVRSFGAATFQC